MKYIDYWLGRITMYRLLLYYLIALLAAAVGLNWIGQLQYNWLAITFSASYLTVICLVTNKVFADVFEAPVNMESVYLTALILALIITPYKNPHDLLFLTAAGGLAISSKFILAIRGKHIFNPAAVAVALTAAGAGQAASWWVGTTPMLPFVLIGGLLVVRKIRRGQMVLSFLAAATVSTLVVSITNHHALLGSLKTTALHSSLFFLAFVMLTEPQTSPTTKGKQRWYGVLAGALFPPQVHVFNVHSTPELTLLVANAFSYIVSPKTNLLPRLLNKEVIAPDSLDFVFAPNRRLSYKPGQYMEWTLPHKSPDFRGTRRYFTLASSPTEKNVRLGVKFYDEGSSFKEAMLAMDRHTPIAAGQLGGDFVLPKNRSQKLVFIAGGIGITPYRSMVKYLLDTDDQRPVTLLYSEKEPKQFAYVDVFREAKDRLGIKTVYTITKPKAVPPGWRGRTGQITAHMIKEEVPDYAERLFYISGPPTMVAAVQSTLRGLGVPSHMIKTDLFTGYA